MPKQGLIRFTQTSLNSYLSRGQVSNQVFKRKHQSVGTYSSAIRSHKNQSELEPEKNLTPKSSTLDVG